MNTGKLRGKINERVQRSAKKQPGIQMPGSDRRETPVLHQAKLGF